MPRTSASPGPSRILYPPAGEDQTRRTNGTSRPRGRTAMPSRRRSPANVRGQLGTCRLVGSQQTGGPKVPLGGGSARSGPARLPATQPTRCPRRLRSTRTQTCSSQNPRRHTTANRTRRRTIARSCARQCCARWRQVGTACHRHRRRRPGLSGESGGWRPHDRIGPRPAATTASSSRVGRTDNQNVDIAEDRARHLGVGLFHREIGGAPEGGPHRGRTE